MNQGETGGAKNTGMMVAAGVLTLALVGGGVYFVRAINAEGGGAGTSARGAGASGSGSTSADVISEARALLRSGNFAEAAKKLQAVIDGEHDDQGVRVAMAQAMLGLNQPNEAYEQYQAALALAGTEAMAKADQQGGVKRNPTAAQLHFEAGTCAMKAGLSERAMEHYQSAQMLDAGEAKYPLFLGMVQARSGEDGAAVASLLRAAKLNPDLAEAWGTMAEIELRRNNTGLALQHVERARALQPNVARWRVVQARGMNRKGDADKALELLTGLDEAARSEKSVLSVMGESYGLLKRAGDAAEMYAKAARANPSDTEMNYQAALWMERAGNAAEAKRFAEIAASLGHEGARALVGKAGE